MSNNPFHDLAKSWWDMDGPFHTLHDINPLRLAYIQQFVQLEGLKVLDLGCGGGILSEALAKAGALVTSIDIESSLIEVAKQHAKSEGLNIDYQHCDIKKLQHSGFDVIVCMEMLEHVTEPSEIIKYCAELLKPDGYLFLSTINRNLRAYLEVILLAEYVLKLLPRQTHDYQHFIRPAELHAYLAQHGLDLVDLSGMAYQPFSRKARLVKSVQLNYLMCAQKKI